MPKSKFSSPDEPLVYTEVSLTAEQQQILCSIAAADTILQNDEFIALLLETIDRVCCFAKHTQCTAAQRQVIYGVKHTVLTVLWRHRQDLFRSCWLHTSKGDDQRCWQCSGSGVGNSLDQDCPRCHGTGIFRKDKQTVLTVFAIEADRYKTTWHVPKRIVQALLGQIVMGDDLVSKKLWSPGDLHKTPVLLTPEQYENARLLAVWFIRNTLQK